MRKTLRTALLALFFILFIAVSANSFIIKPTEDQKLVFRGVIIPEMQRLWEQEKILENGIFLKQHILDIELKRVDATKNNSKLYIIDLRIHVKFYNSKRVQIDEARLLQTLVFRMLESKIEGWRELSTIRLETITFSEKLYRFFKTHTTRQWIWRLSLAVVSFPIIYFIFGIMASPFVMDYYQQSDLGLAIPGVGVIIGVQVFRSILFLLATIPILITWTSNKKQLVLFLGLAHFVFVFSYDFILAIQLPLSLELIHGVEILLDSMIYAWVIVKLLSEGAFQHSHTKQ